MAIPGVVGPSRKAVPSWIWRLFDSLELPGRCVAFAENCEAFVWRRSYLEVGGGGGLEARAHVLEGGV